MKLEGVHHVTCITGDAPGERALLRGRARAPLVKKTVNQDDPTVYHLFYADERGSAGADITFFEYPGSPRGRAGDGMVHLVSFRVGSEESLEFWRARVGGVISDRSLVFHDPEGLKLELVVDDSGDAPLTADAPDIPEEHRIRGFAGVRAYAAQPERSERLLRALGFDPGWEARGELAQRLLPLRPATRRTGAAGRGHRAPRRVGVEAGGARGVARQGDRRAAASRRR